MIHFDEIQVILNQIQQAWLEKNWKALQDFYTSDAEIISSESQSICRGNQNITAFYNDVFKNDITQITTLNINEKLLSEELASVYCHFQLQFKEAVFQNIHMTMMMKKKINKPKIMIHHISFLR
jgi:ketosteroid isomerase-like protein